MKKIMKNKLSETSILLMLTIGLLGASLNIPNLAKGQVPKPELRVEPSTYKATHLNETFNINITINDLDMGLRAVAAEFRLLYNNTLLKVVDVTEGPFMKDPRWNLYGTYFINYTELDGIYGPHVLVGILILPNPATGEYDQPQFPEGNGTLATIKFKTIYRPTEPSPPETCLLSLNDTMILDENLNEIEHSTKDAVYQISPLTIPKLSVDPGIYRATHLGETFNISVTIGSLDSDWRVVAVQFRLCYNSTLLEVVGVTEGPFMKDPRWNLYGTYFINFTEPDGVYGPHILVGIQLLPNATTGQWARFPEGSGTLATITFKAVYTPVEPEPPASCDLQLSDTLLLNDNIIEVIHYLEHGYYVVVEIPVYTIDVEMDVGTIHFGGEMAEFYIFISKLGQPVDASKISATLYYNGTLLADLSDKVKHIATGLYQIPYTIPAYASSGTYALIVKARYDTLQGNALKTFLISQWIEGILKDIEGEIATVIVPNLGEIKANLTAIDAKLVGIDGTTANIETSIGQIQADITDIDAKLDSIDGNIATINSTLGKIEVDTADIKATLISIDGYATTINTTVGLIHTKVDAIHLKVVNIDWETKIANIQTSLGTIKGYVEDVDDGGLATINTDLGTVKINISDIQAAQGTLTSLQYVILVLALIAAIGAVLNVIYTRKK